VQTRRRIYPACQNQKVAINALLGRYPRFLQVALRPLPGVKSRAIQPHHWNSTSSLIMRSLAMSDPKKRYD
jgi:hypothetical protein